MSKLLYVITKEETVNSVKNLIKSFEVMKNEAEKEACKMGYCLTKQNYNPVCDWENINKDGTKVILKFKLEIFEKN